MGAIHVHEFMSLDGVFDNPSWTFEYGFDPKMGELLGEVCGRCSGILLGRTTYEMFEPAWSNADRRARPRRAVLQRHHEVRRVRDADRDDVAQLGDRRALRPRDDPPAQGRGRGRPLRQRQRQARPGDARRRPDRRAASVRLPAHPRASGAAPVQRRRRPRRSCRLAASDSLRQRRRLPRTTGPAGPAAARRPRCPDRGPGRPPTR